MTYLDRITRLALETLRQPHAPNVVEEFDIAQARRLSPSEHLALLNEILLRSEAFGSTPCPSLKPIDARDFRL